MNFKVTDGQNATAGELFELVVEEFQGTNSSLPPDARDIFALWLVSDHLGTDTCWSSFVCVPYTVP